jgi:predicted RNA-binding Zn-ribbon protein involved in translation (DUF1610 family)
MVECSVCGRKKIRHQLYYQALVKRSGSGIIVDPTVPPNVYCWRCRQLHGLGHGRIAVAIPNSRVPYSKQLRPKPKLERAAPVNYGVESVYGSERSMPCPNCGTINWDRPGEGKNKMGLYACEKCGKHYTGYRAKVRYMEKPEREDGES